MNNSRPLNPVSLPALISMRLRLSSAAFARSRSFRLRSFHWQKLSNVIFVKFAPEMY